MKAYMYTFIIAMLLAIPVFGQNDLTTPVSSNAPVLTQSRSTYAQALPSSNAPIRQLMGQEDKQTVFIVPSTGKQAEDFKPIIEDLYVMCRIFDKMDSTGMGNLPALNDNPSLGAIFQNRKDNPTEALYLQGYGIVFFIKVPFALDLSESEPNQTSEEHSDPDPLWQSVKEETLYGNRRSSSTNDAERDDARNRIATAITSERLLRTLKYAANIRSLKPDEKIIVRMTGNSRPNERPSRSRGRSTGYGGAYGGGGSSYGGDPFEAETLPGSTTLIAHTTKADVDGYNRGKLTFEQFKEKANLMGLDTYGTPSVTDPTRW